MPLSNVHPTSEQRAYRERVADGARLADLTAVIAAGPYHSDDPLHHAAVDCEALRSNVHALADHRPALRSAAAALDVAASELSDLAEAAGL